MSTCRVKPHEKYLVDWLNHKINRGIGHFTCSKSICLTGATWLAKDFDTQTSIYAMDLNTLISMMRNYEAVNSTKD
jgi:hypothetical protein